MSYYENMNQGQLEGELRSVRGERDNIHERLRELGMELSTNEQHMKLINRALGLLVLPGNWHLEPRFIPSRDDPFLAQESVTAVRSIYE